MKKISISIMITMMTLALCFSVYAADSGAMKTTMSETKILKASDLLNNTSVKNAKGENLGKISDLAITRGNVVFAVISHGFDGKLIPVPISALKIEDDGKTARLDVSSEKLETAPYFTSLNWGELMNSKWTEDTYKFYGVSPSWKAGQPEMEQDKDMMKDKEMKDSDMMKDRDMMKTPEKY